MNSKRILAIASLIHKDDIVLDVGCDHAYLDIYLTKNKLCKRCVASDVSKGALNHAKTNISKFGLEKKIKTVLSDGLVNINDDKINTIVISGMGTSTILEILKNPKVKTIKKIIIQSNNNLDLLRKTMNKNNYKINHELVVFENNKYYSVIEYSFGKEKINYPIIMFGKFNKNNKNYYDYLYQKNVKLIKKLPKYKFLKIFNLKYQNIILKRFLKNS